MTSDPITTFFGIRHHGPGCARSLARALAVLQPDLLLVELPADLEGQLGPVADAAMTPPVALLVYQTENPERSSFYPFAEFSPEWQAFRWSATQQVPCRCCDLPAAHTMALRLAEAADEATEDEASGKIPPPRPDPFDVFAEADGYSDGERWWNDRVEERGDDASLFAAINEAVTALRQDLGLTETKLTLLREAWMRKCLRAAESEGFKNIAVVCGAWHLPALQQKTTAAADNALLKGLPKVKISSAWIPWTYERLAMASGYGAGVRSPGWYGHLWSKPIDPIPTWLTLSARILRKEGQEASSASVIEAIRLANSLAGMRGRPQPGLDETLEAMQTVFCMGDALPLNFLRTKLLIGEVMGKLPESMPKLPLQQDIEALARSLRLKFAASVETLELDLREENGRKRSVFLHRLLALQIHWGSKLSARSKGTFKESWRLAWKPDYEVAIISAAPFGNTLETAAHHLLLAKLPADALLPRIAEALDLAVLAQLPDTVGKLLVRLDDAAAASSDVMELLDAVSPLARTARYGDVRKSSGEDLQRVVEGFAARIHAALPGATHGLQEEAADRLAASVAGYGTALGLLEKPELTADFHQVLEKIMHSQAAHATLRGQATRLLHDASAISSVEVARQFSFALSAGMPPLAAGCWLEGFLRGAGSLLLHDRELLGRVDDWVKHLSGDAFQAILPMLRRTFGSFTAPERARIATAIHQSDELREPLRFEPPDLDLTRALPAVQAVARLFAIRTSP
jgi:hypothetical protein